ncbi:hypothetical protein HK414_02680 [Ramlibacter terrae]|uniref:Uncharacterized protein n=1 Tax=Ramlibacter terrae TaxID=2732511 RepID=A0ABX6P071_9BURK|nr:hypothetical protein HK414_02680 [Ramlibacter terrae]
MNLFDLQGNVTSEIRSSGAGRANEDLSLLNDAGEADRLRYSRRTDIVHDALGRVTARESAARREQQGGVTVDRQDVDVAFTGAAWLFDDQQILQWVGENRIELQWNNLAALGSGDVKVTIEYLSAETTFAIEPGEGGSMVTYSVTQGGVPRKFTSEAITSTAGATGTKLTWKEDARSGTPAGSARSPGSSSTRRTSTASGGRSSTGARLWRQRHRPRGTTQPRRFHRARTAQGRHQGRRRLVHRGNSRLRRRPPLRCRPAGARQLRVPRASEDARGGLARHQYR